MTPWEAVSKVPSAHKAAPCPALIHELRRPDLETWIDLRAQLWPDQSRKDLSEDADSFFNSWDGENYRHASMRATVLLAELPSNRIIGFAEVDLRPYADGCHSSPVGYLEGWYVCPDFRGRGVGRALLEASEEWARQRGCTEMASDTQLDNTGSRRAHRAVGYTEVEQLVHFRRSLNSGME